MPPHERHPDVAQPSPAASSRTVSVPESEVPRAGRAVLERIAECIAARADFAFETTYVPPLRKAKAAGFQLQMYYLWLPSADLALLRIRHRVESGGHDVPEVDVRRRFGRTLRNLFKLYRPLLDTLHFFDNASEPPQLAFNDEAGKTTISDTTLYGHLRGEFGP